MAASTITRATWVNDTGSAAVPNADGTLITNTRLQNDVYAPIDQLFAGAGAYATFAFGGLISAEGFGSNNFVAGGTGGHGIAIRNTTAGTGNYAALFVGNNGSATAAALFALSSTYTTAAHLVQDSFALVGERAGGISVAATNAAGVVRFYAGGSTEGARVAGLKFFVGDTTDADITQGICINQGANITKILSLKNSGVAHGLTGGTEGAETDSFAVFMSAGGAGGGLKIIGLSEAVTTAYSPFTLLSSAATGSGDTTKSTAAQGYFRIQASENQAGLGANENIAVFADGAAVRQILDSDGDSHQDIGTAWTTFDGEDDVEVLNLLTAHVTRADDPLRQTFGDWLQQSREPLERLRLVAFNEDGHHFVNMSRLTMLLTGAVRQLSVRLQMTEAAMARIEGEV